ncbi:MAG: peptide deformylase [Kiritimatiellae bacterium]|jgi:peptide deformylase|nr:peptide deformylase [Kiritimatiellia bacterium]
MKYEVLTYGNGALRTKSKTVEVVDEDIKALALDMLETMYAAAGVGLAAEQVGRDEAIFVVDILPAPDGHQYRERFTEDEIKMPLVAINPEIKERSGECIYKEGCLSFPGITANVTRPESVVLEYTDLEGKRQTLQLQGLLAEAIDHENDHLDGVLIVDRMSAVQKVMHKSKLKKLMRMNK